jgi:hypothetical protein
VEGEHVAVGDAQVGHGLGLVGDELAIVVEVLGHGFDTGLGLDGALKGFHRHLRVDVEGEEVALVTLHLRVGDTECYPPATLRGNVSFGNLGASKHKQANSRPGS